MGLAILKSKPYLTEQWNRFSEYKKNRHIPEKTPEEKELMEHGASLLSAIITKDENFIELEYNLIAATIGEEKAKKVKSLAEQAAEIYRTKSKELIEA
ncbi:MAG: hypothetical protein COV36_07920 [Alphaproteobacteria bacterium CG11_big_fil_rev_8_21_14_0_20_44_7]|nr:MAG: hypothetical protein COV36_07920 [Alphaproteobacteria bacterium CG11_big_fil_rev_8_21_14_0_20_44_7]